MPTIVIPGTTSEDSGNLHLAGSGKDVHVTGSAKRSTQIIGDEDAQVIGQKLDLGDVYVLAGSIERGEIAGRVSPDHDLIVLDTSNGQGSEFMVLQMPSSVNLSALKFGEDFTFQYHGYQQDEKGEIKSVAYDLGGKIHSWTDNEEFAPEADAFGHRVNFDWLLVVLSGANFQISTINYENTQIQGAVLELDSAEDFSPIRQSNILPAGTPIFYDEMLVKGDDGKFYHVVMPMSADRVINPDNKIIITQPLAEGEPKTIKGTLNKREVNGGTYGDFIEGDNVFFEGEMNVSGMSTEGTIRRLEVHSESELKFKMAEVSALAGPFDETFIICTKEGDYYAVSLPADFATQFKDWGHLKPWNDVTLTDLDITYMTTGISGETTTGLLSGNIVAKRELDDKTPVNVVGFAAAIVDSSGNPVTNRHDKRYLDYVINEDNPFYKGNDAGVGGAADFRDKMSYDKFATKKKALINKLERLFFDVEVNAEWADGNRKDVVITVRVVTAPRSFAFGFENPETGQPASKLDEMIAMVDPMLFGDPNTSFEDRVKLRAEWANNRDVKRSLLQLRDDIGNEICTPIDHDSWEKTLRRLTKLSRKNDEFEVASAGIAGLNQKGQAVLDLVIRPKPKDFAITFKNGNQTVTWSMKDVGMNPDKPIGDDKLGGLFNNYAKKAKQFYEKVSEKLEKQGKVFAVEVTNADGSTRLEPYSPKIRTGLGLAGGKTPDAMRGSVEGGCFNMFFAVNDKGEPVEIKTVQMPTKLDVSGLPDDMQPGKGRLERLFNDKKKGHYTAESIFHGIAALTRWYTAKGYPLRNGHLDYSIDDKGVLHVSAKLYKVKSDVEVIIPEVSDEDIKALDAAIAAEPNPAAKRVLAEKKETLENWQGMDEGTKKKIQNEFRLGAGDNYNVKKFYKSINEVQNRYHVLLIPSEVKNEETGEVTLRVVALQKDAKDVLNQLNFGAGVASNGAGSIGPTGEVRFDSQLGKIDGPGTGHVLGASVTGMYAGGVPMGGASASVSSPADEHGGRNYFSVSGALDPSYLSSVGAGWKYRRPIGDSNWSMGPEVSASMPFGDVEGANVPYGRVGWGASYDDLNGLTGGVSTGLNFGPGAIFGDVSGGVNKRWNLSDDEKTYAEVWAKAGVQFGKVPTAMMFGSTPYLGWSGISAGNAFQQSPVSIYAMVGAALMRELVDERGFGLDMGVGAVAGANGPIWSAGVGVRCKIRLGPINMSLILGPSVVNGVPTLLGISFD